jgi:hypothetical protein
MAVSFGCPDVSTSGLFIIFVKAVNKSTTIQELKKDDRFTFNDDTFKVKRKYIDDDRPLIAANESKVGAEDQLFHNEELEVVLCH